MSERSKYRVTLVCSDGSKPTMIRWAETPEHAIRKATKYVELTTSKTVASGTAEVVEG